MKTEILFEERQRFAIWVYMALIVPVAVVLCGALLATGMAGTPPWNPHAPFLVALLVLFLALFILNLLFLQTQVSSGTLYLRMGLVFPVMWKRMDAASIETVRCVAYRPLIQAGGWGWRLGWFKGRFCWFFNARGRQGVLVETGQQRYIIGSQDPERLRDAIEKARAIGASV